MSHELEFPTECRDKLLALLATGKPMSEPLTLACCSLSVANYFAQKYLCPGTHRPLIGAVPAELLTEAEFVEHLKEYDQTLKMGVPSWLLPLLLKLAELIAASLRA